MELAYSKHFLSTKGKRMANKTKHVLNVSKQDYDPQGASVNILISENNLPVQGIDPSCNQGDLDILRRRETDEVFPPAQRLLHRPCRGKPGIFLRILTGSEDSVGRRVLPPASTRVCLRRAGNCACREEALFRQRGRPLPLHTVFRLCGHGKAGRDAREGGVCCTSELTWAPRR